jgi:release factor glutamine methyltransferase
VGRLAAAVDRRVAGEPLPYVVGRAGFRTLELDVDRRVLIPRPETEGLVELVLRWASARGVRGRVADVGTGSGCIALALAVEGKFSEIIATDSSALALDVARANRERIRPPVPIGFRLGHLLEPLGTDRFDVVVSNPPYVSVDEFDALEPSVREYEPRAALASGGGGLAHTRALLEGAASHVVDGGLMAIEIDAERPDATLALALTAGWADVRLERDLFARPRYLLATKESQS